MNPINLTLTTGASFDQSDQTPLSITNGSGRLSLPRPDDTRRSPHAATTAVPQQFPFTRLTVMDNYLAERSRLFTPAL